MKFDEPLTNPPEECKFCSSPRIGIQERRVYFKCGSVADFSGEVLTWKECQVKECQPG